MTDHPEVTISSRLRVHIQDHELDMFKDETPNLWIRTMCGKFGRKNGMPVDGLHRCRACQQAARA